MSPLFRRKPADVAPTQVVEEVSATEPRPKNYTPSKKELGVVTPKRVAPGRRVQDKAPENRKEAYKQMRERQRAERAEANEGMRNGDERYLLARDRGPERALVRDIVDSRRTVGSWFIAGAVVVLIGSSVPNRAIQNLSTLIWAGLALAVLVDSILIARKIKKLVRERFPQTTQRMGSLYLYGIMRGLTFRRMRIPKSKVEYGDKI
ncbi:DUF3043 domain-containing protein [Actinoplanes sp. DH11]|uniref:DUF3043 domain-containing protein n=1 Tax=Actinoplanes sp. DH11 TaxID=2857011 RepID=UPI001E37ACED|nr:DUF3043 domain-containing protein [Actinoplanes sp. DH11]